LFKVLLRNTSNSFLAVLQFQNSAGQTLAVSLAVTVVWYHLTQK